MLDKNSLTKSKEIFKRNISNKKYQIYSYFICFIINFLLYFSKENIVIKKINTNKLLGNNYNNYEIKNENNDKSYFNSTLNTNNERKYYKISSEFEYKLTPLNKILRNLQSQACSLGCLMCLSSIHCLKCDSAKSFLLYYVVNKGIFEFRCRKCIFDCEVCSSDNHTCEKCNSGFYKKVLVNATINSIKNTCEKCGESCKECDTENECISCNEDKFYYNEFENKYSTNSTMINISQNNTFVGFKRYSKCTRCDKKTCEKCYPENNEIKNNIYFFGCEKPKPGYYLTTLDLLYNNKIKITSKCQEGCSECRDFYTCDICDNEKGYRFINSKCVKCSENCQECKTFDLCFKCSEGFFSYIENDKNTYCKPCKKYCKKCENYETCSECIFSYNLNNEKTDCNYLCEKENCEKCDNNGSCEICQQNFVLEKSTKSCKSCLSKSCKKCSSITGKCEECLEGSFLRNTECLPCASFNCDNCSVIGGDFKCHQCSNGFFLNNLGICENCQIYFGENCGKCDGGGCLSCINSSIFIKDNISKFYGKCIKCGDGFFMTNGNRCERCDNYYDLCDDCNSQRCFKCNDKSILIYGVCECNSALYIRIGSSCLEIYIIILPILTILLIILGIIKLIYNKYLRKLRNRNQNVAGNNDININNNNINNNNNGININIGINNNNVNFHVQEKEKLYKNARKNEDNLHGINCVFCNENTVYWKFDCSGFMCNPCSLKLVTSFDSDKANCPKCEKEFKEFKFILSLGNENKENVLIDDIKQNNKINLDQSISDNICKICFVLKHSVQIKCQSNLKHFLCYYCYNRMILIENLKQCPFDRTEIK
jgi:hypothetical protein